MKDIQIKKLIDAEKKRQKSVINLIASENYVSRDVLEALGSELTNKYAEGYPGKRYYGGNTIADKVETLAIQRALKLFGLSPEKWHVNVQPLSGSPANMAVYTALVPQGGRIMGMSLDNGGHLTHGHKVSATGKFWTQIPYGVDKKTEVLDYDEIQKIALNTAPHIIVAGYTAYPRIVDFKKFRQIADACGSSSSASSRGSNNSSVGNGSGIAGHSSAILMVDMSHFAGLVAGKAYPSPFEYADVVTTTVHKTLRGPRAAMIFIRKDRMDAEGKSFASKIDKAVFPGLQGGPHLNQIAAVAVALKEASTPAFKSYAKQVIKNAHTLAGELQKRGWHIVSGGTDSHLILMDTWLQGLGISGGEASDRLEHAGIIVNKNTIPGETRSAMDPSGIRLGTAAETTRGAKEKDMLKIAAKIDEVLRKRYVSA
jgi:glycine hydroxymethyltransferase